MKDNEINSIIVEFKQVVSKSFLTGDSKRKLTSILNQSEDGRIPTSRSQFLKLLIDFAYLPEKGLYIPLSDSVYLDDKDQRYAMIAKKYLSKGTIHSLQYFTNGLRLQENADRELVNAPIHRLTNSGLLFITLETDPSEVSGVDRSVLWTCEVGDDGSGAIWNVDKVLCQFKDYRGFCAVYSGGKSVHFHFVFDTKHIRKASYDAAAEKRKETGSRDSGYIKAVYAEYWDRTKSVFEGVVGAVEFDMKLRQPTQWRRMPYGIRKLEKDDDVFLNARKGERTVQLVLDEKIRTRAPRDSTEFCVSPEFSPAFATVPDPAKPRRSPAAGQQIPSNERLASAVKELGMACAEAWGPNSPIPVSLASRDGDWLIGFSNGPGDQNPSSVVKGEYRHVQINSKSDPFSGRKFPLPDNLSANEWGDYLNSQFGLISIKRDDKKEKKKMDYNSDEKMDLFNTPGLEDYMNLDIQGRLTHIAADKPIDDHKENFRNNVRNVLSSHWISPHFILVAPEGSGKTHSNVDVAIDEAFNAALHAAKGKRFLVVSCRSRQQARTKAAEFREKGHSCLVVETFWNQLERACNETGTEVLDRDSFSKGDLTSILTELMDEHPEVYARLKEYKDEMWSETPFDSATTILFMTHRAAQTWHISETTRFWLHPDFKPIAENDKEKLEGETSFLYWIMDDPELDDFVHIINKVQFETLAEMRERFSDWKYKSRNERTILFSQEDGFKLFDSFDEFDALMRIEKDEFAQFSVDYHKYPYGQDNPTAIGIYKKYDEKKFYIAPADWISALRSTELRVLTTEQTVLKVATSAFRRGGNYLRAYELDAPAALFPVHVPTYCDSRARSKDKEIVALASEIVSSDQNAVVISDGLSGSVDRATSFQKMKGENSYTDKNIYIIATFMSPEKYAELNVLAQFAEDEDFIDRYHLDQLQQAIGRNEGFRKNRTETKTAVIMSSSLFKRLAPKLAKLQRRIELVLTKDRPW